MLNTSQIRILIGTALILAIPFVAGLFSPEVNWSGKDFAVMGLLLLGTGFLAEWLWRLLAPSGWRWLAVAAIALLGLLMWIELAVGVFGSPLAGS